MHAHASAADVTTLPDCVLWQRSGSIRNPVRIDDREWSVKLARPHAGGPPVETDCRGALVVDLFRTKEPRRRCFCPAMSRHRRCG